MTHIGIIDCGISNLTSVKNAFDYLCINAEIVRNPHDLPRYSHLVLPGVGAFRRGMQNLHASGFDEAVVDEVQKGKPVIGLCLGMQLLAEHGEEFGITEGLGLIPGDVVKLQLPSSPEFRLPHVGWNDVQQLKTSRLWRSIDDNTAFYFVHSYVYGSIPDEQVIGTADYGSRMVAVIEHEHIFGTQFHPEKSQKSGLQLLKNFAELC